MKSYTDVIVIGAGHAGLAMSHYLGMRGIDHVVLERGEVGHRWVAERWPSLRLLSPDFMTRLPGFDLPQDAEGFMSAADFAATLGHYAKRGGAPIHTGCEVRELRQEGQGFEVLTSLGTWRARAVVIATGACDRPKIPAWAAALPSGIRQVTTAGYRGPDDLDRGGVLVVGASATGAQLAAEIRASGRPVTLAVGRHVRTPRRYRGRDLFHWLDASGFLYEPRSDDVSSERATALPSLQLIGSDDGREIGLQDLRRMGVRIAGRAIGFEGGSVRFAPTLERECEAAELRRRRMLAGIDWHIAEMGLDVAEDPAAWAPPAPLGGAPEALDPAADGIRTVVWATGFRRTYPWLMVPGLDGAGEIVHRGGVTPVPGLFALGLPFMRHRSSALIYGVGRDAEALAPAIAARLDRVAQRAA